MSRPISIPRGRVLVSDTDRLKCKKCRSVRFFIAYRKTDNMIIFYCIKCGKSYKLQFNINGVR